MSHDEYTDFSCSTSIERLSRDVETLLRSWYLVGTDRHVSFSSCRKRNSMPNLHEQPDSGSQRRTSMDIFGIGREEFTTEEQPDNASSVQLIRSKNVNFVVPLHHGGRASVPLTLALWDGPSDPDGSELIPLSLRRLPFEEMPRFDSFSTLFGIGQHITLSVVDLQEGSIAYQVTEDLQFSARARHDENRTLASVTMGALSSMLQMALNCAVSNCQCSIPVFGTWGVYQPGSICFTQVKTKATNNIYGKRARRRKRLGYINRTACVPPLNGSILEGATFSATRLPAQQFRVAQLGNVLSPGKPVALWGARYTYRWKKIERQHRTSILFDNGDDETYRQWRTKPDNLLIDQTAESVDAYRERCRHFATTLVEHASGATDESPIWGCPDDPLKRLDVIVTWNGRRVNHTSVEPLLLLPLRIRSRNSMSGDDLREMEEAMESAILNPLAPTATCFVEPKYDESSSVASLAASQRCVLSALIRTAALHPDTLLQHVTNEAILDEWYDTNSDSPALEWIMNHANIGPVTRRLVDAMNWADLADDLIEYQDAENVVKQVLNQTFLSSFPSPPEEVFSLKEALQDDALFEPLNKAAPFGRLISVFFAHMARLRSPSSMALVWIAFVTELRNRWYTRSSLPNMGLVPGLDYGTSEQKQGNGFSTIGVKAPFAAFVHCSEPDPDEFHCLVGQKLQVFNICIESLTALELLEMEKIERQHAEQLRQVQDEYSENASNGEEGSHHGGCAPSVASTELMNNVNPAMKDSLLSESNDAGEFTRDEKPLLGFGIDGSRGPIVDATPPKGLMGAIAEDGNEQSTVNSANFCDATEGRSLVESVVFDGALDDIMDPGRDDTANVIQRQNRKGARCPVHGVRLVASGDQLYAPYLQRPNPLTDKVIQERRFMLTQRRLSGGPRKRGADGTQRVQDRIELAHRLQKPKLLSDMRAFKAANPGAVFQDFINWYGNPRSPLDEFNDGSEHTFEVTDGLQMAAAQKIDRAAEAIHILTSTRDFWSDTWDEATPCAATEQEPLFDVEKTGELILHHMETLHPASLLNQIMAVNLATSYFVLLSSAKDLLSVVAIRSAFERLRDKTVLALRLLSRDATDGSHVLLRQEQGFGRLPHHASSEAISECEVVCDMIAEVETLVCRATSLLHKFPGQYDQVQKILRRSDGDDTALEDAEGRRGILNVVQNQGSREDKEKPNNSDLPSPHSREYLLRNQEAGDLCQLYVRVGGDKELNGSESRSEILLAKTSSCLG